jgi:hypothetical protein
MSDQDHVAACAAARFQGIKQFFIARGHDADEAHAMTEKHLRGETVHINEPPSDSSPSNEEPKQEVT